MSLTFSCPFLLNTALIIALTCLLPSQAWADLMPPKNYKCDKKSHKDEALDLSGAKLTFQDGFLTRSVTSPEGQGPWYSPVHGGFGEAKFLPPDGPISPFDFRSGYLFINMFKKKGRWYSGIMQSVNKQGRGFAQTYGYFEMKAMFRNGYALWPAFWLKAAKEYTDRTITRPEIDVIEAYSGKDGGGYHTSVHLWPTKKPKEGQLKEKWNTGCYRRYLPTLFDGVFHTYGAEISPEWVIFYYDRKEVGRVPTLPEFKQPLYMLVDLARYKSKEPTDNSTHGQIIVDYIKVWQRPEWRQAK